MVFHDSVAVLEIRKFYIFAPRGAIMFNNTSSSDACLYYKDDMFKTSFIQTCIIMLT